MNETYHSTDLARYITDHTERGECNCGKCIDRGNTPDPLGHTVDLVFFKVALRGDEPKEKMAEDLRDAVRTWEGEFANVDPFDGQDHTYLELGAWLGSQELALRFIALGALLGEMRLITPRTLFGPNIPEEQALEMAGIGLVAVRKNSKTQGNP